MDKVIFYDEGSMKICTKFHDNPSNCCSVWTKVVDQLTDLHVELVGLPSSHTSSLTSNQLHLKCGGDQYMSKCFLVVAFWDTQHPGLEIQLTIKKK